MPNQIISLKEYLQSIDAPSDDKKYALNFCNKLSYLEAIKAKAINDIHSEIISGYGNVNSKICFIFKDESGFNLVKPLLQDILEKFNLNFWDVYVTFLNKTNIEYSQKYSYLANELYAVSPKMIYSFIDDRKIYDCISDITLLGVQVKYDKYINILPQLLGQTDEKSKAELWNVFKYLINYKDI